MAKSRRSQKQCPQCGAWVKGTRAKVCPKCNHQFGTKPESTKAAKPVVAATEKATVGIPIAQIKAVAEMVQSVGGFDRVNALLGLVRNVGGQRRLKELLDAMAVVNQSRD